jgi:hypothetical protein
MRCDSGSYICRAAADPIEVLAWSPRPISASSKRLFLTSDGSGPGAKSRYATRSWKQTRTAARRPDSFKENTDAA